MKYAKIVDGKLEYAPYEIYTEDGKVIELDTVEKCLLNGYKKVVTFDKPIYDKDKYELIYLGYEYREEADIIVVKYDLREKQTSDNLLEEMEVIYKEGINK